MGLYTRQNLPESAPRGEAGPMAADNIISPTSGDLRQDAQTNSDIFTSDLSHSRWTNLENKN